RDSSTLTVVLGRTNKTGPNLNEVSRGINQTFCHPLFNVTTSENDICLVQLSSPVEFSDYVSPVCLAAANSIFSNGNFSWTVGIVFGGTEVLNELQVQILENNECQNRSSKPITDNKICTRDNQSREAPCLSSLGPSLRIQNEDLVWIQLGIAVSGVICKSTDFPPVYTRVSRYQEWIRSVTGSSQPGFVIFPSSLDDGVSASTSSPSTLKTTPTTVPLRTNTTPTTVPLRTNTPPTTTTFGSSGKLSSTIFTSVSALLFSLVLLVV
ncbi:unnamed protein product, partial [Tetraodon nigroviridis]